ncbi:hypothetical protein [Novipirellula caenicola]
MSQVFIPASLILKSSPNQVCRSIASEFQPTSLNCQLLAFFNRNRNSTKSTGAVLESLRLAANPLCQRLPANHANGRQCVTRESHGSGDSDRRAVQPATRIDEQERVKTPHPQVDKHGQKDAWQKDEDRRMMTLNTPMFQSF